MKLLIILALLFVVSTYALKTTRKHRASKIQDEELDSSQFDEKVIEQLEQVCTCDVEVCEELAALLDSIAECVNNAIEDIEDEEYEEDERRKNRQNRKNRKQRRH